MDLLLKLKTQIRNTKFWYILFFLIESFGKAFTELM